MEKKKINDKFLLKKSIDLIYFRFKNNSIDLIDILLLYLYYKVNNIEINYEKVLEINDCLTNLNICEFYLKYENNLLKKLKKDLLKYSFLLKEYNNIYFFKYFIKIIKNILKYKKYLILKDDTDIEINSLTIDNNLLSLRKLRKQLKYNIKDEYDNSYLKKYYYLVKIKIFNIKLNDNIANSFPIQNIVNKHLISFNEIFCNITKECININNIQYTTESESSELDDIINKYDIVTQNDLNNRIKIERVNTINNTINNFLYNELKNDTNKIKFIKEIIYSNNKDYKHIIKKDDYIIEYNKESDFEWLNKFRPRKPHYFNRVKLGYEWTKINQKYYTLDNPPPRDVMGYKFNIFYPNLLDKKSCPSYELINDDDINFSIIKFIGGCPYENLSFKIVNRNWNKADRKTFKCNFENGIFYLYFEFEKSIYRR